VDLNFVLVHYSVRVHEQMLLALGTDDPVTVSKFL